MPSLLSEIHFWTTQDIVVNKPNDFGCFKYYYKKDGVDNICEQSKQNYCESRGGIYKLNNKRPHKLRDKIKEFEELLLFNKIISYFWKEPYLYLLLSRGILLKINVNIKANDIISIYVDKQLCIKLQNEIIWDGAITATQTICLCSDGKVYGIGSMYKEPWTVEGGLRKHLSLEGELLAVWGKNGAEHPQPWSPLAKEHQRANILLYWAGARGPELLSYKKTDGEPILVKISKIQNKTLVVVEQKVTQKGAVSIEVSCLELNSSNLLKRVSVTAVPLQTQVSCCALSKNETFLLLGCIDSSLAILNRDRGSTHIIKTQFIPTMSVWHPSETVAVICNERGQLQYYDTALNCVKTQLFSSEEINSSLPITTFDLSSYFNNTNQPSITSLHFAETFLVLSCEQGPLVILTHIDQSLDFLALIGQYLRSGKLNEAIGLMLSWDFDENVFAALQKIIAYLLKLPLTESNAQFIQNALGVFHSPAVPLSPGISHRFGLQVKALTRKFFHQLVRAGMHETAFLLAVDLAHHDLFMDLHFVALKIGETEMAAAAKAQASSLLSRCSSEASHCSRSSCSQCLSSSNEEESSELSGELDSQQARISQDDFMSTNFNQTLAKPCAPPIAPPIPNIDLNKINKVNKAPPLPIIEDVPKLGIPDTSHLFVPSSQSYYRPMVRFQQNQRPVRPNFLISKPPLPMAPSLIPVAPPVVPSFKTQSAVRHQNFNFRLRPPVRHPLMTLPPPLIPQTIPFQTQNTLGTTSNNNLIELSTAFNVPVTTNNNVKKPQAKVKFSDTVTAFIVPEVKRPVRPAPPAHVTDPQKELADSLPLCHPNEDYLKDFTPVNRNSEGGDEAAPSGSVNQQPPKIKVVHFGVV